MLSSNDSINLDRGALHSRCGPREFTSHPLKVGEMLCSRKGLHTESRGVAHISQQRQQSPYEPHWVIKPKHPELPQPRQHGRYPTTSTAVDILMQAQAEGIQVGRGTKETGEQMERAGTTYSLCG
jgi:hypothetical protein